MNLFEIDRRIEEAITDIFNSTDEETGEVDESCVHVLEDLQMQKDEKIENIGCYIKNLNAEIDAFKAEEANMKHRREVLENKRDRLKTYISNNLNGEKWDKSTKVQFSFRSSESVIIDDETIIPKKYLVKKVDISPDKKAIKEVLKSGQTVKGVHLDKKMNLQVK